MCTLYAEKNICDLSTSDSRILGIDTGNVEHAFGVLMILENFDRNFNGI